MLAIPNVQFVYLYPQAINIRLSEAKLIELCKKKWGSIPSAETSTSFSTAKRIS